MISRLVKKSKYSHILEMYFHTHPKKTQITFVFYNTPNNSLLDSGNASLEYTKTRIQEHICRLMQIEFKTKIDNLKDEILLK